MILSNKHFSTIENHFVSLMRNNEFYTYRLKKYGLYNIPNSQIVQTVKPLFNKLKELNVICVVMQYKEHSKGCVDQEIKSNLEALKHNVKPEIVDNATFYNNLCCLKYQIEIEHIEGLRDDLIFFHTFLLDLIDVVANYIASKLPHTSWHHH